MPRLISLGLAALLLFLSAAPAAAETEGREYVRLPVQTKVLGPDQAEVALFFWYGCGGCFRVEKMLAERGGNWPEGAVLVKMHAASSESLRFHGRIYLALKAMNAPEAIHLAVFDAFQNKGLRLTERADLPELIKFLKINGVEFMKAFDAPEREAELDEAAGLMSAYGLQRVPAMVVNGRYTFDLGMVNGPEGFISLAEKLLAQAAAK